MDAGPDAIAAAHAAYAAIDAGTYDAGPPMVSDADQVIAALRPKFRACYSEGLQRDPKMEGCTVVRARVASDGAVSFSEVFVYDGLSREVAECIAAAVAAARFSAPGVDGTRLMVPVTFVQPR